MARTKKNTAVTNEIPDEALFPSASWKNHAGDELGHGTVSLLQIKNWRETLTKGELISVYANADGQAHLLVIPGKTYWVDLKPERPVIDLNGTIFRAIDLEREKEIIASLK